MSRNIVHMTRDEVAEQIASNPVAVMPFGSIEQHGPHFPNGTDTIASEVIAAEVAERLNALYVPFGPYGVTPIHAGHPGTIDLGRPVFEALLQAIATELIDMGIERFVWINWHEGNIASMDGVAMDLQAQNPGVYVITSHACYTAQRIYKDEGGDLPHGGGIEAIAVMAHDPALMKIERAGEATRPDHAIAMDEMRRSHETHGYITDVSEIDDDGWYGNPRWATQELAEGFADRVSTEVVKTVEEILALRAR